MSKVLVIHPSDRSTDFLKLIYEGKGYDVIDNPNIDRMELARQIDLHDKIIMLGHGTPMGLLNPDWFGKQPFVIDRSFVELLSKKETISIWCYSDLFFKALKLKGFHTGMIISECAEQRMMLDKIYLNTAEQLANMEAFATIVGECIEQTPEEMQKYILEKYNFPDEVTQFNRKNIKVL